MPKEGAEVLGGGDISGSTVETGAGGIAGAVARVEGD
jgi:hypothetical protein